jgi:hypothetical protein
MLALLDWGVVLGLEASRAAVEVVVDLAVASVT